MSKLERKLAKLSNSPGVYFFKGPDGEIIYIGKAAVLRNRVRQYFQKSRPTDAKTQMLVNEMSGLDWTEVETEVDALFLEAELVKRYLPRYNILLRDDKSLQYVRIDYKSEYPTVTMVRRPLDDKAEYFGPYINGFEVKKALRYLRRAFPYAISKSPGQKRASLYYHLGLDPGLEEGKTALDEYRSNLRKLMSYLRGNRKLLVREIEREMKSAAKAKKFEEAAKLRNQLRCLQSLSRQIIFSDHEIQDASKDRALVELTGLIGMKQPPRRIEGFDISHIQGSDTTASMVVFADGIPHKTEYRKFKMLTPGNDDFAHMHEALSRRLKPDNLTKWGRPDLILIDGGKGQLNAAMQARKQASQDKIPMIGLAKRFEDIILLKGDNFEVVSLPHSSHIVKLLQRIRDESHRFAVSYHSLLRSKRQTTSLLDGVPGIGPATRKKLIAHFGSGRAVIQASPQELIIFLGPKQAQKLINHLNLAGNL